MIFLNFISTDFYHFAGFIVCLIILLKFFIVILQLIFRFLNMWINGYPPPHCDADGDFKTEPINITTEK